MMSAELVWVAGLAFLVFWFVVFLALSVYSWMHRR